MQDCVFLSSCARCMRVRREPKMKNMRLRPPSGYHHAAIKALAATTFYLHVLALFKDQEPVQSTKQQGLIRSGILQPRSSAADLENIHATEVRKKLRRGPHEERSVKSVDMSSNLSCRVLLLVGTCCVLLGVMHLCCCGAVLRAA